MAWPKKGPQPVTHGPPMAGQPGAGKGFPFLLKHQSGTVNSKRVPKAPDKKGKRQANWIAGAIKRPGALHRQLGVPQGKKIPKSKLRAAAKRGGKLGKRARLAETLGRLNRRKTTGMD